MFHEYQHQALRKIKEFLFFRLLPSLYICGGNIELLGEKVPSAPSPPLYVLSGMLDILPFHWSSLCLWLSSIFFAEIKGFRDCGLSLAVPLWFDKLGYPFLLAKPIFHSTLCSSVLCGDIITLIIEYLLVVLKKEGRFMVRRHTEC